MTFTNIFRRWLPVGISYESNSKAVQWLDFGNSFISDPFYVMTIRRLMEQDHPARARMTSLNSLLDTASKLPAIEPSGVIFHISRCGSTLLSNIFRSRENVITLVEATPIKHLIHIEPPSTQLLTKSKAETRKQLLDAVLKIYAERSYIKNPRLIIKGSAIDILQLSLVRSIWPNVPFVVVIREPVEVVVSNLAKRGGWVGTILDPIGSTSLFGLSATQVQKMTLEDYCTTGVAAFLEAAQKQMDGNCWIVDYKDLTPENIWSIAELFGIRLSPVDSPEFQAVFNQDAKDYSNKRPFRNDSERKQTEASSSLKESVRLKTANLYSALESKRYFKR